MKLGLATATPEVTADLPLALLSGTFDARLEKAARLGYDGVELLVARPGELDPREVRGRLQAHGLEPLAVASGAVYMVDRLTLLAAEAEPMRRAALRLGELVDFAAGIEAPLVTVGGFRGRAAWAGADGETALLRLLEQAARQARRAGIRLALEPLNRYETDLIHTAAQALDFVSRVGADNLGLLLDTFHMNIEERSPEGAIRQAGAAGRLFHVHLGDSNRLPPGQGHIDFAGVVRALREVDYGGALCAELLPLPDPDTAARQTAAHMLPLLRAS